MQCPPHSGAAAIDACRHPVGTGCVRMTTLSLDLEHTKGTVQCSRMAEEPWRMRHSHQGRRIGHHEPRQTRISPCANADDDCMLSCSRSSGA